MGIYLGDTTLINGGGGGGGLDFCCCMPNPTSISLSATGTASNDCYVCCCFVANANGFIFVSGRGTHINGNGGGGRITDLTSSRTLFCNFCSNCCTSNINATIPVICGHTYIAYAQGCKRGSGYISVQKGGYIFS